MAGYVHLVDGTYELFRAYYGAPKRQDAHGREIGASRALLRSFAQFIALPEVTHVGVAFDTVIESFRNRMFVGYKTGAGIDPDLFSQFPLAERVTRALGLTTWSMVEFEADDALATAAQRYAEADVSQVRICSPDKDLCQCVIGTRVVLFDRKNAIATDEPGVVERLGVPPKLVPAYLALVGDAADGIPGIPRWGEKSARAVLNRYGSIEDIPEDAAAWDVKVRGAKSLAEELNPRREQAALYQQLATLRVDVPIAQEVRELAVETPDMVELQRLCRELAAEEVFARFHGP